jgi:hypothetical protein
VNIFAVSADPVDCARALDDRRLVKMVLETAQLLSAAAGARPDLLSRPVDAAALYRPTHLAHPVSRWVRENGVHFRWTCRLLEALLAEYTHRFGREHACRRIAEVLSFPDTAAPPPTAWCNCTPYPALPAFEAYRTTLNDKWAVDHPTPTWRDRGPPSWRH